MIPYPGAPPTPPYDNAGWTLAFQMGVQFDRVLDAVHRAVREGHGLERQAAARARHRRRRDRSYVQPATPTTRSSRSIGCSPPASTCPLGRRAFYVAAGPARWRRVQTDRDDARRQLPDGGDGAGRRRAGSRAPRIGLWDQYGGSMESGWTRWILEQFEFPFTRVYAPELDAGNLNAKYDVLIFVERRDSRGRSAAGGGGRGGAAAAPAAGPPTIPAEYRSQLGRVTADRTIPQLRAFVENGGTSSPSAIGDEPGGAPQAADRESPGRERRAAAAREVLRARLGADREGRHHAIRSPPA